MIDTSDGLLADMGKLLASSELGATVDINAMPLSPEATRALAMGIKTCELLNGGDDYELCFTVGNRDIEKVQALSTKLDVPVTKVGQTHAEDSLTYTLDGHSWQPGTQGFDHFLEGSNASKP